MVTEGGGDMRAAVMRGSGEPLVVEEVPDPEPARDGAVVRVEACGICRSDWHAWVGDMGDRIRPPHVLGHEFVGVVEAVGPEVRRFSPGDRVIAPFSWGEGDCPQCRAGAEHLCDRRVTPGFDYWGGYARYVATPMADRSLVPLPEGIGFVAGASLGCRFMTAFHGLVDRAAVRPGEWVAVHGLGGVGLSAVHILTAVGARVVAVDIRPEPLARARALGAAATVDARAVDPAEAVRDLTGGGAQVAVDALGLAATCRNAVRSLAKRGRHVQIGLTTRTGGESADIPLPVDFIVRQEITLLGSLGMPSARYEELLRLVEAGVLDPGSLVGRRVRLAEAGEVLAAMTRYETEGVTVIDRYDE